MAARDVLIRINANASGLFATVDKAKAKISAFDAEVAKNADKRQAIEELGNSYGKMGLAAAAGLGASVKAAMDWETAWTGVLKTVDGSAAELDRLETGLRNLAKATGFSHSEVAAVAEAAGQLGISTPGVEKFTETMLAMGVSTNLSSEEAATGLARLRNILGSSESEISNMGSTMVALGNNFATTEGEILEMSLRIAGAGRQAGLTESDVMGLAAAMSSVGIEAEAGGTAVSLTMKRIGKEVETNGKQLGLFAKTANMSVADFKKAWNDDAAGALTAFVAGLGDAERVGMSTNAILRELGITGIREADALLRLSGNAEGLAGALDLAAEGWSQNSALADEAGKFYGTASQQMKQAWAGIKDNLIDIGASVLPVLKDFSNVVKDLTGWFSALDPEVQGTVTRFLALTAALGGGGFAVSRAVTGFSNLTNSINDLYGSGEKLSRGAMFARGGAMFAGLALGAVSDQAMEANKGLGVLTTTAGGAAIGFAVGGPLGAAIGGTAGALYGLYDATKQSSSGMQEAETRAAALRDSLDGVSGKATEATRALAFEDLRKSGAAGNAAALGINSRSLVDAALGDAKQIAKIREQINEALVSGDPIAVGVGGSLLAQLGEINSAFKGAQRDVLAAANATSTWAQALESLPKDVQVELKNRDYQLTLDEVEQLRKQYDLTPEQVETVVTALGLRPTQDGLITIQDIMGAMNGDVANLYVNEGGSALGRLRSIAGLAAGLASMNPIAIAVNAAGLSKADGGIVDYYANGGLRENHTAQIAPAGAMRVWAEPETGGEAYIPLAQSKRERSLAIWAQTGNRLGVQGFADGGIVGGSSSGPLTASLVGAQVAIDPKTNLATFIRGEIQVGIATQVRHDAGTNYARTRKRT